MINDQPLQIVDRLMLQGVDVVVIGGHAVLFHGYLRATEDIDLIFRRTPANEVKLFEVLREIDAFWIGDEVDPSTKLEVTYPISLAYTRENSMMLLGSRLGYIDLFDFVPGWPDASFDDLWKDAVCAEDGRL